jgi:hypothetical protein
MIDQYKNSIIPYQTKYNKIMKCKVQLYVAGKVFYEEVHARDYKEAKEVALARNPNAKVVSVNAMF